MDYFSLKIRKGLWTFFSKNKSSEIAAWWLGSNPEPVLIDCPSFSKEIVDEVIQLSQGKTGRILLTNRDSHGMVRDFQSALDWPVVVQEQEAYLLAGLKNLETFKDEHCTKSGLRLLWTPGPSPGSCVVHSPDPWNVLFCGRLLTPINSEKLVSLRTERTFHWSTQRKSLKKLRNWISLNPLPCLASGVNLQDLNPEKLLKWEAWDYREMA